MINNITLTGRPVTDIELKETQSGIKAVQFNLAVNRSFKNKNGEIAADFIPIVAFEKTAELLAEHVKKGHLIGVEGRLQQRTYEDKNGATVYVYEVIANQIIFLQAKGSSESVAKEVVKDKDWANAEYKKRIDGKAYNAAQRVEIQKQIALEMDEDLPF